MLKMDHISKLLKIGYFKAPSILSAKLGHEIPPNSEIIEIITGGNVYYKFDGREQLFGIGTIFWHLPGEMTIHKNVIENPYECLVLSFKLKHVVPRQVPEVTVMRHPNQVGNLSSELLGVFYDNLFDKKIICQYIYNRFLWEAYCSTIQPVTQEYPRSLRLILDHIHKHYGKDLLVEDLAEKGGVSAPYLFALFKKHIGGSPHKYLLTIRLKEACALLAGTTYRIKRISDECGFMNTESFCRTFKKAYKMTPGKYRERSFPY